MYEQILFDQFHAALDIEPNQADFERLRAALLKSTPKPQRRFGFPTRGSKMGLRLAAFMTIVVLAIAGAATFLATHRVADRTIPADSNRAIAAYKLMVSDDWNKLQSSADPTLTCGSGSQLGACEADVSLVIGLANQQLNDLNRFHTPPRFAVADAQLRRHVAEQIARLNALLTATRTRDTSGMSRAVAAITNGRPWLTAMLSSILRSQQGTVATYTESVRSEKQSLNQCSDCQELAGQNQISCAGDRAPDCQALVDTTVRQVTNFQTAVVDIAAPSSLADKDSHLQLDLATADSVLVAMADALAAGDQAGFNAGRGALRQALAAVDQDASAMLNS